MACDIGADFERRAKCIVKDVSCQGRGVGARCEFGATGRSNTHKYKVKLGGVRRHIAISSVLAPPKVLATILPESLLTS